MIRRDNKASLYTDELTIDVIAKQLNRIRIAFPNLKPDFFNILSERIKANNFTNKRLIDSVDNLIDNFTFQTPTVAEILKYDNVVQGYTYNEILEMMEKKGTEIWSIYKSVRLGNGKILYFEKEKIENIDFIG
jgi:hypothetical protein